ncbi:MAG: S8 family serine peptidase, partial [Chloroflexota bacterium]|nr:S8 family serine peptidase [Chloroflexota bacterium]
MGRVRRLAALPLALLILCTLARPVIARTVEPSLDRSVSAPATTPLIGVPGPEPRLLVRFAATASSADRERAIASVGGTVDRVLADIGVTRIAVPNGATEDASGLTALRLSRDAAVVSVEPDSSGSVQFAPNDAYWLSDPSFGVGQWGLRAASVDKAWDFVRGSPLITVAVIDTGIDANHPDLLGVALPGVTFVSSPDPSCTPGSSIDDNGHGTHVAGVIAANANNGPGIAGVAFGVRILPVKALDCTGAGLLSDVASGVIWATDHGARIINISLGSNAGQATLQDAIRYAVARNVLVVAAAGNCGVVSTRCGSLNEPQFPGAFPEVLAVAATDQADGHAAFSNVNGYVDISAPGVRIWSTTPTYPTTLSRANPSTTVYAAFSGTSQAAPLVAGIAALLLSSQPSLTGQQLTDRLRATADDQGAIGVDDVFGMGRANALRAVTLNAPARYGATYDISALPKSATFAAPIAAPITI